MISRDAILSLTSMSLYLVLQIVYFLRSKSPLQSTFQKKKKTVFMLEQLKRQLRHFLKNKGTISPKGERGVNESSVIVTDSVTFIYQISQT